LGTQVLGILACIAFVFPVAFVRFYVIKNTIGVRVKSKIEETGIDLALHGIESYPEFAGIELKGVEIEKKEVGDLSGPGLAPSRGAVAD
jgi:Amt family ammonium transporter